MGERGLPAFGARLRRLRETAGLTQEGLAERAGLSVQAIGALERGDRRRPHPHTLQAIAGALGLDESERAELMGSVARRAEVSAGPSGFERTLPLQPTPLIGRERELREVRSLVSDAALRLVTITGPGGVGKTRLAIEAAAASAAAFADGVVFVPLAPLADSGLVLVTIEQTLGLRETGEQTSSELLRDYLGRRQLLLILDNFEHVLAAASEVADLIGACPKLTILATSRAPLRVRAEREFPLGPLAVPDLRRLPTLADVAETAAAHLFVDRAQASQPSFALTQANSAAVAAICHRLDGLPLALELAAARVRALTPTELLARLDRALPLLSRGARDLPERQQTMQRAIEWSFDLLGEREQELFLRLSVFAGGWDLLAAEVVGAGPELPPEDVVDLLHDLVDQSLVVAISGEMPRYRMLEPVRQYALERLRASGGEPEARRRHAEHIFQLALTIEPELKGPLQVERLARLEAEHDNLRATLGWLIEQGDLDRLARLGFAVWLFWWMRGYFTEGLRWMSAAFEEGATASDYARGWALLTAGVLDYGQAAYDRANELFTESLPLFERIGDEEGQFTAIGMIGLIAIGRGDYDLGASAIEEAVRRCLAFGNRWTASMLLTYSAAIPLLRGEYVRAEELSREGLALAREMGDRIGVYAALYSLARIARARGHDAESAELYGEALRLSVEMVDRGNVAYCLEGLGEIAVDAGDLVRSATLWGAAEALLEGDEAAIYVHTPDRAAHAEAVATVRTRLDAATWDRAWSAGQALSLDEAVAYALGKHEDAAGRT